MSLIIRNVATDKQIILLRDLGYIGKQDLTMDEARKLIDELIEEVRVSKKPEPDQDVFSDWDNPIY